MTRSVAATLSGAGITVRRMVGDKGCRVHGQGILDRELRHQNASTLRTRCGASARSANWRNAPRRRRCADLPELVSAEATEEVEGKGHRPGRDITPASRPERDLYSDAAFAENFLKWVADRVRQEDRRRHHRSINSKAVLTEDVSAIRKLTIQSAEQPE